MRICDKERNFQSLSRCPQGSIKMTCDLEVVLADVGEMYLLEHRLFWV